MAHVKAVSDGRLQEHMPCVDVVFLPQRPTFDSSQGLLLHVVRFLSPLPFLTFSSCRSLNEAEMPQKITF